MPQFRITAPDGAVYNVTAPEGATEQDALAQIQAQHSNPASSQPSIKDKLVSAGLKGFTQGGLVPAMTNMAGVGLDTVNEAVTKGAYNLGGEITDLGAKAGLPPAISAGFGFAGNVGLQAVPALAGGIIGKTATPSLEGTSKWLMQSALKPSVKDLKSGNAAKAIQTMLDEGISVSESGVAKLKNKIGALNEEIAATIANSPATIDKSSVYTPIKEKLDYFSKQINPNADLQKIKDVWNEFLNHPLLTGDKVPVQLAQQMKQTTGSLLAKKYGQMGTAEDEAQKAITRGLKEQIAAAVPEIGGLNAQESALINAKNIAERRALMEGNKNPFGLGLIASHPASILAFLADRSAWAKSGLARLLYSGKTAIPETIGAGAGGIYSLADLQRRQQVQP